MIFYRYEAHVNYHNAGNFTARAFITEYYAIKETERGYWISTEPPRNDDTTALTGKQLRMYGRWVSKTARKRYAYPTKAEALINAIARSKMRIFFINRSMKRADAILKAFSEVQQIGGCEIGNHET